MEAKCKLTRIIGFTCCLAILAAMSADRGLEMARAADPADPPTPTFTTVLGQKAHNVKVATPKADSLTGYAIEASGNRSAQGGANDACTAAEMIGDGSNPYCTNGNGTDGVAHAACQFDGQTYHDDWFTYIATCSGTVTASTCNDADYDTDMVVYAGYFPVDWACPPGDAQLLGCNDDFGGDCAGFSSEVTVAASVGDWLTIRVGGWMDGDMGCGNLTITCDAAGPVCGDDVCNGKETCKDCPGDCGPCPGGGEVVTCSENKEITPLNSVACSSGGITTANQFARCFDGATHFPAEVTVTSLDIGIEVAEDGGASNMLTATLYSIPACAPILADADLTLLGSAQIDPGTDGSANGTIQTIVFAPAIVVPAGTNVVAEISYGDDTRIWPGSNPNGQTCLSYIGSDACGLFDLTDLALIGVPNMHLVLNLNLGEGGGGGDGDECEDCLPIATDVPTAGTTTDNTGDVDDTSCAGGDTIDEWYCWTASCDGGTATASLCGSDPFDTTLAVFDACGGDEIACNDDLCGLQSELSWSVSAGNTYNVRVSGWSGGTGDFTLLITENCPGPCEQTGAENDCCGDAIGVECGDTPYDSTGANTDGPIHPECQFDGQTYSDLWWEHIAGDSGNLNVSLCDSSYDTDLVVYDGCDCGALVLLDCNDDSCPGFMSEVNVPVVGGNCYLIRTGGFQDGDAGNGVLSISGAGCAPPCGNGECGEDEDACSCPEDCPGECACTVFTNQADFEAFNAEHGKELKGIEDFEEGILDPNAVDGFDDPLCGGIPNAPDGFPYPVGLTQLNMCVQSNIDGGNAGAPNPQVGNGLAAASQGFLGAASDIVISNTFVNSLDLMFGDPVPPENQDNHTGIGFDTLTLLGGATVDIQVYDKDNVLMIEDSSPADLEGNNFWGVWCSSTIGRINIFDPATGAEGGDNIQLWKDVPFCQSDDECDDGNACTDDICAPGEKGADENGCLHIDVSADCDDGDVCNGQEICDPVGGCQPGIDLDCNDDVDCTVDDCDSEDGCSNSPDDSACNDGDVCNGEETCDPNAGCQAGDDLNCNDDVDCTIDGCDADAGCTHDADDGACDDGNVCNGAETCDPNAGCQAGDDLDCNDGEACTADSCDPETGCVHEDVEQTLIIKQGASGQGPDCHAPINSNSNGVIPILLVGTGGFDVHDVDQGSLDLHLCGDGPSGVGPIADHTKFKDLNHPTDLPVGCPGCQCNDDESSDGIDDLSMKFRTSDVVAGLPAGAYTLELTGTANGVPFCARDCVIVGPPGSGAMNATMESNVSDTLLEVTPMDLNFDIDGFADFSRAFIEGTTITLTAPSTSEGRRFLRWSVNGEMQGFGIRRIDVTIDADTTLKAFYQRPGRVVPKLPTEGSGDME